MKKFNIFLIGLLFLSFSAQAQILNSSFEDWNSGQPDNWYANQLLATNVTQTSDAHHGASAAKMEIVNFNGIALPAALGTIADNSTGGHPISIKYSKFKGYVKANLKGGAAFWGGVIIYDENQQGIGAGTFLLTNPSTDWTPFEVTIEYFYDNAPFYLNITFTLVDTLEGDLASVGSTVIVDHLTLDTPTSVESNSNAPLVYELNQNYPNPFNPSTTIRYSIPNESEVTLTVYNAIGAKVDELYSGAQTAGNYEANWDASDFTSGVYFLRMSAVSLQNSKRFSDVKKLILLK